MSVITSYSIHYTKLYDRSSNYRIRIPSNAELEALYADMLKESLRITSYNVCYTKLLRERLLRYSQTDLLRSYSALVEKHFRELHKVTDYARITSYNVCYTKLLRPAEAECESE